MGSWLLLGVIVTSLPLPGHSSIAGCQTGAEAAPAVSTPAPPARSSLRERWTRRGASRISPSRRRGAFPEEHRAQMGRQVFGCDICQDVCPWNRKAPIARMPGLAMRTELINPDLAGLGRPRCRRLPPRLQGLSAGTHRQKTAAAERRHRDGQQRRSGISSAARSMGRRRRSHACRGRRLGPRPSTLRAGAAEAEREIRRTIRPLLAFVEPTEAPPHDPPHADSPDSRTRHT